MSTIDTIKVAVFVLQPYAINTIRLGHAPSYTIVSSSDVDAYLKDPDWLLVSNDLTVAVQRPTIESATTSAVEALRAEAKKLQAETGKRLTDIDAAINQLLAITNEVPA